VAHPKKDKFFTSYKKSASLTKTLKFFGIHLHYTTPPICYKLLHSKSTGFLFPTLLKTIPVESTDQWLYLRYQTPIPMIRMK
jgi:hypothetical protein